MKFTGSAFFAVCAFLLVIVAGVSYYRFIVLGDYIAEYEGECDPVTESCFVGCEDEEDCSEVYYYTHVQKHAADLRTQCGTDISECAEASQCLPDDRACTITYCSAETLSEGETCEDLDETSELEPEEETGEEETEPMPL